MAQLELPEVVYDALLKAAAAEGVAPPDWIAERLPRLARVVTQEEREAANARLFRNTVSLGYPTGTDNESIDADLARAYLDDHAPARQAEPEP